MVYQVVMYDALMEYQGILAWISGFSLFFFLFSLAAVPWLISRIPETYFSDLEALASEGSPSKAGIITRGIKNIAGFLLVLMGIVMLFIPGQGILTILAGLILSDFPGKTAIVMALARKKNIRTGMNWIRKKKGVLPLKFPE
ncbi:MAG: PGPGW domain-containing protein [Desulfobacter sp.]